eukprot:scpid88332/ scgid9530/ 
MAHMLKAACVPLQHQRQLAKQRKLAMHQHRQHVMHHQQVKKPKQKECWAQCAQSLAVALTNYGGGQWMTDYNTQQNLQEPQMQLPDVKPSKVNLGVASK